MELLRHNRRSVPDRAPSRWRRAKVGALILAVLGTGWSAGSAQAERPLIERVGSFPITGSSEVHIDRSARLIYEIASDGNPGAPPGAQSYVGFRDADTLKPKGRPVTTAELGSYEFAPMQSAGGYSAAVDERRHLLFVAINGPLVVSGRVAPTKVAVISGTTRKLLGVMRASIASNVSVLNIPVEAQGIRSLSNLYVDPPTGRLYAVLSMGAAPATILEFDPSRVRAALEVPAIADYTLPQCYRVQYGQSLVRKGLYVYLACAGPDFAGERPPDVAQGIFKVALTEGHLPPQTSQPTFTPLPGAFLNGGATWDPVTTRLMLTTRNPGPRGSFVFDGEHQAVIGLMGGEGRFGGSCVDDVTGRVYLFTLAFTGSVSSQNYGLLVGGLRDTPLGQGLGFPQLVSAPYDPPAFFHAACDSPTRRVIYRASNRYVVLKDNRPPPTESEQIDSGVVQPGVPDVPGASDVTYSAQGRAFGARMVFVGGYRNLANTWVDAGGADAVINSRPPVCATEQVDPTKHCGTLGSGISPAGRYLVAAAVGIPGTASDVAISNYATAASADPASRNSGTEGDMTQNGNNEDPWPFSPVVCTVPTGATATTARSTMYKSGQGEGAKVTCDPARALATGSADPSGYAEIPGVARIVGANASVTSRVDDVLGAVTESTARVASVSLAGGAVQIEGLEATATASARGLPVGAVEGRPDSPGAKTTYTRRMGRLVVGGKTVCDPCGDFERAVAAINAIPEGVVQAFLPKADADGSQDGTEAVVHRNHWEQTHDQAINEQSTYDQQVPALRLVVQEDTYQHSALIIDLAGPQAEAHRQVRPCFDCSVSDGSGSGTTASGQGGLSSGQGGLTSGASAPRIPALGSGAGSAALGSADAATAPPAGGASASTAGTGSGPGAATTSSGDSVATPATESGSRTGTSSAGSNDSGSLSAVPAAARSAVRAVGRNAARTATGLKAVATSPQRLAKVFLMWSFLAIPIYLSSRRRLIRSSQRTV